LIVGIYPPYIGFQEPSTQLKQEIIDLTGITMDMLAGQTLDIPQIDHLIEKAEIIIAHNSAFDRPFVNKICCKFSEKKWACSMVDVDWKALGYESLKLSHLAADLGFYFEPHQADKDCLAGLAILTQLHTDGQNYFEKLIDKSGKDSVKIRAEYAPFEAKDILKQRGYSWKDGSDGKTKGWEINVIIDNAKIEKQWLSDNVYNGSPRFSEKIENAYSRFKD
jgi:DNA polymerase-3 subunit epsilon